MTEESKIRLLSNGSKVTRIGTYTIDGQEAMAEGHYWDYVITGDGATGYVARDYLRDTNGNVAGSFIKVNINKDDEKMQINISPSTTIDNIKQELGNITVKRADGTNADTNDLRTGDIVTIEGKDYAIVKIGDAQGDGLINFSGFIENTKILIRNKRFRTR